MRGEEQLQRALTLQVEQLRRDELHRRIRALDVGDRRRVAWMAGWDVATYCALLHRTTGRCVCFGLGWRSDVCVSAVCVSAVLCLVCLPLRVRPRVCPVPELRFGVLIHY